MKKKLLIIVTLVLLLVGCGKVEKFYLDDEHYTTGVLTDIDVETFEQLEKDGKNFALFVYLPGCTSCAEFRAVLEDFIVDNDIEFYTISILDVKETSIMDSIEYAPSMMLYKDGKLVDYLDATSDEDKPALTNVDSFKIWLEEYVYLEK